MTCNVCGYAVDIVRSCYESTWNFPDVGRVRGYLYFSAPGTPFYPDWHFFGSRNWHRGDGTPEPEFGELSTAKQKWRDGSFAAPRRPELITIGTKQQIGGELPPPKERPPFLVDGVDIRCWRGVPFHGEGLGGDLVGGAAIDVVTFHPEGVGGDLVGGAAIDVVTFNPAGVGGDLVGGAAIDVVTFNPEGVGGDLVGGAAIDVVTFNPAGVGGDLVGGAAADTIGFSSEGQGLDETGGSSTTTFHVGSSGTGGVKVGGAATSSKHP